MLGGRDASGARRLQRVDRAVPAQHCATCGSPIPASACAGPPIRRVQITELAGRPAGRGAIAPGALQRRGDHGGPASRPGCRRPRPVSTRTAPASRSPPSPRPTSTWPAPTSTWCSCCTTSWMSPRLHERPARPAGLAAATDRAHARQRALPPLPRCSIAIACGWRSAVREAVIGENINQATRATTAASRCSPVSSTTAWHAAVTLTTAARATTGSSPLSSGCPTWSIRWPPSGSLSTAMTTVHSGRRATGGRVATVRAGRRAARRLRRARGPAPDAAAPGAQVRQR